MFKRKIEKYLKEWKSDEHKMPLIIKGCRQCGKTFSVLDFAHKNYEHVVYIDFSSTQNTSRYLMVAWTSIFSA